MKSNRQEHFRPCLLFTYAYRYSENFSVAPLIA